MDYFNNKNKNMIWSEKSGSEYRILVRKNKSLNFPIFLDKKILNIGSHLYGRRLRNLMTMANKVEFKNGNLGSGGGWHRDHVNFQFKAILYLTNVSKDSGAFEFIKDSNKFFNIIKDSLNLKINVLNTRIENNKVKLLDNNRIKTLEGKAGTLILVDTSMIHRGKPLNHGSRYAITNYYYHYFSMIL